MRGMLALGYHPVIFPLKVRFHLTKSELPRATKMKGNALLAVIMEKIHCLIVCDLSNNKLNTLALLSFSTVYSRILVGSSHTYKLSAFWAIFLLTRQKLHRRRSKMRLKIDNFR
jgi:hypothetical protein